MNASIAAEGPEAQHAAETGSGPQGCGVKDGSASSARETVFPPDAEQTDKTDETYIVGNGEFLRAVFGDELADARPVVVSFEGNPASVPAQGLEGQAVARRSMR